MPLPPTWTPAEARAVGLTRGHLRGPSFVRLAHGLTARLDDAVDESERLRLVARVLPADAAYSHATAAALLGAPVDAPRRAHIVLTPRRVLPQRAEFVTHARRLLPEDVVQHRGLRLTSGAQTFLDLAATPPPWDLVAVGDALMRAGHLDQANLARRLSRAARVRGVVRARECAPLLSSLAMPGPRASSGTG
ncbi:hypothetical protein [Blastococcus sp. KM273128]|uniref:hypothetical protein n=1 Tax=Blastococcus sp. KM273128 TaxID=2570314 RepID=UPI001F36BA37|nr:hypothetical protein [Blastococcus sp. KM273128]